MGVVVAVVVVVVMEGREGEEGGGVWSVSSSTSFSAQKHIVVAVADYRATEFLSVSAFRHDAGTLMISLARLVYHNPYSA